MTSISNIRSNLFILTGGLMFSPEKKVCFFQRAIADLTATQDGLDHLVPNSRIQDKIDSFLQKIEETFERAELVCHLEPAGNWKRDLAQFLAKLPKKVAFNILNSLKNLVQLILQSVLYTIAHPMKAPFELAKKIILFASELSQPEAWVRIGANGIGSSLGYTLIAPNPISPIVLVIAAALVAAGVSVIALRAALDETSSSIGKAVLSQGKTIVEEMATGLCLGMLIGGVQRAVREIKQWKQDSAYQQRVKQARLNAVKQQAGEFVDRQGLPGYDRIGSGTDSISIYYDPKRRLSLPNALPGAKTVFSAWVTDATVIPQPNGGIFFSMTKTEMMGYRFGLQNWAVPPAPAQIPPVSNLAYRILPASALAARASSS